MFQRKLIATGLALALVTGFAQAREIKSVGVTVGSLGNPFFVTIAKGAEAKVKELYPNAKVLAVVDGEARGPKIRVFKKKRRKGMRRTKGHRATLTRVRIKEIVI